MVASQHARLAVRMPLPADGSGLPALALVVLLRIAAKSCGEAEIARDLQGLCGAGVSAGLWRTAIARHVSVLTRAGHIRDDTGKLACTADGRRAAIAGVGARADLASDWDSIRDGALVAKALGIETQPQSRLAALKKADGLRALIVEARWGLKIRGQPSSARVRAALAVCALKKAFGNKLDTGELAGSALSAKAGRLLAGQLADAPRDFKTDARLVAALAAEAVGVRRPDLASLRHAVLRRFVAEAGGPASSVTASASQDARTGNARALLARRHDMKPRRGTEPRSAANPGEAPIGRDPSRLASAAARSQHATVGRLDPKGFAAAVLAVARACAQGWPGNRKAFVSEVWSRIQEQHAEWRLSEIEFKCMLTEAHRAGLLMLAHADLKDRARLADVQASAVIYKNAVWHYVRVEA